MIRGRRRQNIQQGNIANKLLKAQMRPCKEGIRTLLQRRLNEDGIVSLLAVKKFAKILGSMPPETRLRL